MRKFDKPIILASKSPRRKEILSNLGYEFNIMVSSKEEIFNNELSLSDALKEVALQKAYDVKMNIILLTQLLLVLIQLYILIMKY